FLKTCSLPEKFSSCLCAENGKLLAEINKLETELSTSPPGSNEEVAGFRLKTEKLKVEAERLKQIIDDSSAYVASLAKAAGNEKLNAAYFAGTETALRKVYRDIRLFRGKLNDSSMNIAAAGNEYECFQIALFPLQDVKDVSIACSDLVNADGGKLSKNCFKYYPVYFVPNPANKKFQKRGGWPDALLNQDKFDLEAGVVQPVWVEIYVPAGTMPGIYRGILTICPQSGLARRISLNLRVWNFTLPVRPFLKTSFGLRTDKYGLLKYYSGSPVAFQKIMDAYKENMLRHRVSFRTNTNVRYVLGGEGTLNIDFSAFDQEAEKWLPKGLTCINYGLSFGDAARIGKAQYLRKNVYDENLRKNTVFSFGPPFSEKFQAVVKNIYRQWGTHIRDKGWSELAYNYLADEPQFPNPFLRKVTEFIHNISPDPAILVPMTKFPDDFEEIRNIDIWTYHRGFHNRFRSELESKRQHGGRLWWYISYDYLLTTQDLLMHRSYLWDVWKNDIEGLLYWTVNSWTSDPWRNLHRYPVGEAADFGNAFLIYPGKTGPVNTIRLKVLRDGLEDYDYFRILKNSVDAGRKQGLAKEILAGPMEILADLSGELPAAPETLTARRIKIAQAIEFLNIKLKK
ncbi:MAG: DUF6067 family protein, partial [Victivallaceae bacterium]|nr:DUF6067 family protein [Victivallaceae bacterium]